MSGKPDVSLSGLALCYVDLKDYGAQILLESTVFFTYFWNCKPVHVLTFFFFFLNNFSMLIFQLTYFHFHLFISGTVVFSVDFIGGLDTYSYRQPPQEHVELKPVKPVGKVLVLWTTLILLTGLKANLLLT